MFSVTKFSDISEKIIPFFEKHPLSGVKYLDYLDYSKVADIMRAKGHLITEGLNQITKIKNKMNRGRK